MLFWRLLLQKKAFLSVDCLYTTLAVCVLGCPYSILMEQLDEEQNWTQAGLEKQGQ